MPLRLLAKLDALPGSTHAESSVAVVNHLRTIMSLLATQLHAMEQKSGLADSQLWALNAIASNESLGVSALADTMGIHQSTASNTLKPLMERGLVSALRSSEDRRAVHLQLTPKARRLLAKAPSPFTGVLAAGTAELDPATLRRLERDLGRLVDALEAKAAKRGSTRAR